MEGIYKMKFILIHSNLSDSLATDVAKWRIAPRCKSGGGCDAKVTSISGNYTVKMPFINNRYRFSRRVAKDYTCGSGSEVDYYISGVREVTLEIVKMKLIDDEWTATKIEGTSDEHGTRTCGFSNPEERFAIRGSLN
ncbi:MAG: hypothetical protein WD556_13390 [Actinomycetota bacterium]